MGRKPCCAKEGLNRGTWTARENKILANYINIHGEGKWRDLPLRAGLKRCGKSCRLRWMNYLRPDVKRGNISEEEEELIIKLHNLLGNRWSLIAGRLPGRTDNEIKNYWNTKFRKSKGGWENQNPIKRLKLWGKDSKSIKLPGTETELHKVIRTKAVRCTKVVLPQKLNNPVPEPKEVPTCDPIESPNSSSPPLLDQHHSPNFSMDFDISKILISDVLNDSEFHVPGFEALQRNYSSDETMQESWKERDQTVQPNEVLDLKTIASFFNSEGEWTI